MATWEAKNMLTREQTCSMCDTRYRFNAEIKAESSENSYEAEMKLREKMRNEMVRDFSNDPVKCPGCQKMTPAMWRKAITKSMLTLVLGGVGIGIGILICVGILDMAQDSGLFAWGALLFVGFWTLMAMIGVPYLVLEPVLKPIKGFRIDAPPTT
ncbi:MAG: hypothetical protein CMH90_07000 [Oceanicaulis sp.]|jgi:hypothetical protein|uniref:hypothetical protein n=1 Tax=Oceanicaulis TaxID=153232 RepID=UPI0003B76B59|nr:MULTISPECIES: hypothetical protein [Oceanicaulis]MAP49210.1 hypothetical protein [Oceanicaulis sp.]MBL4538421.1 hypothetical protein [Oceanicaulis sp.]HCR66387.1 hypothetical protein [Oceanicaulis sp.]|tara:strand:+ start:1205 stop:1669 length:465 start_codon:yes stop_codon:yes gene_type:complete